MQASQRINRFGPYIQLNLSPDGGNNSSLNANSHYTSAFCRERSGGNARERNSKFEYQDGVERHQVTRIGGESEGRELFDYPDAAIT